jgi:ribosomal protein L37E
LNIDDYPKPIVIDGLAPLHKKRHTAGTKERCLFCGTKTYRYIGGKPVCSYCSGTEQAHKLGPNWKGKIVRTEKEQMYAEN